MRQITEFDGLTTDRMVEFTDNAPEALRGKRIPMMCDEWERYRYTDLVDLENGTTLHLNEKRIVKPSGNTHDFNALRGMGILKDWYPYQEITLRLECEKTENIECSFYEDDNFYIVSTDGILVTNDGKDLTDLTEEEEKNLMMVDLVLNTDKVVKWFEEHNAPISTEAVLHNFQAWQTDEKAGYLDEANKCHVFSPCAHNPLQFRRTTLHPTCAEWQKTYTWG